MVGQSDEIYGVTPINWKDSSWKHLSLVGDEEVISLSHAKVYVFCFLNPCNVVAQLVTSQRDAVDLTLTCFSCTDVLGPSRIAEKTTLIIHWLKRTLHPFCVVSHSCMVAEQVFLELGYWFIPGIAVLGYWLAKWHLLKKLRCWEVNSMSSLHSWLKFVNSRRALRWPQRWQDSRKPRERWDSRGRNRAKRTWVSGSQSRTNLAKTLTTGTSRSTDTRVRSILPVLSCWKQRDNHQQWWWRLHHTNSTATLLYLLTMLTQKGAGKVVRKAGNNGFEAYRQLCLMFGTSDQEGSTGLFVQIMTYKFGSKIEDVEDRQNEFLELVRRYDEANGTDPVPDHVKKRALSRTHPTSEDTSSAECGGDWGLLEEQTHLQDDFSRKHSRWRFNGSRCRLPKRERERQIQIRQGQEGWQERKRKPLRQRLRGNDNRTLAIRRWMSELADCWYKQPPKPLGEGKGTGKSKSKVTEISESDSSKQVEETWTSNTSTPQPSLSQVKTTGCADEGLWIFSLEDSKKRRYTVNWEDQSWNKTEDNELMIDSGCFGHVCTPWFAPQFPMVS